MNGRDEIKDLFGEKLSGFEANVRPELWANISSQISTVPVGTGMSLFTKVMIGISVAASVGVIGFYITKSADSSNKEADKQTSHTIISESQKENPSSTIQLPESDNTQSEVNSTSDLGIPVPQIPVYDGSENVIEQYVLVNDSGVIKTNDPEEKRTKDQGNVIAEDEGTAVKKEEIPVVDPVKEEIPVTGSIGELFNIFTPNGDGANDVLYVESKDVTDFSIVVIDQQNKIVYQSTDASFGWDGRGMNGDPIPAGKYIYYVTARNSAGKVLSKHSVLQISR